MPNDEPARRSEAALEMFGMVDEYLARFGAEVGAKLDPLDRDGFTDVSHGDVVVGINVHCERRLLMLLVRVADVPDPDDAGLYRRLLELNFVATLDCSFAIDAARSAIYLRAIRRLPDLSYEEFSALLTTIVSVAEELAGGLL